jgi:CheY-like chemotaxis protein
VVLDLNAVVSNMGEMLRRLIGEDIALVTVLGPGLGRVKADPGQVEQVIMNLAINARDAMPHGGRLTLETANVELGADYARQHVDTCPGPHVMLALSDTGVGMDAATQARIFEPFFTTKGPGKGTGLGLAMVYGIVKQSGGSLWVYSEPGQGTTFKFYLPLVDEPVAPAHRDDAPAQPLRGLETILLVEDEEAVRDLARDVFTARGYTVLEARQGSEALRICERHAGPIHLMLTDVVMPEMSGRELADRLAVLRPGMKVLYMSGYTDNAVVHHGILDPGTIFLQKPFSPAVLAKKVREVLDARTAE